VCTTIIVHNTETVLIYIPLPPDHGRGLTTECWAGYIPSGLVIQLVSAIAPSLLLDRICGTVSLMDFATSTFPADSSSVLMTHEGVDGLSPTFGQLFLGNLFLRLSPRFD